MSKTARIYLGLGSNMERPLFFLQKAIHQLQKIPFFEIEQISSVWKTSPIGFAEQPDFLNAVVCCYYNGIDIHTLHEKTRQIEHSLGKVALRKNGPRRIDIDFLYIETISQNDENLIIPHPRFHERLFALLPFQEVYSKKFLYFPEDELGKRVKKVCLADMIKTLVSSTMQTALVHICSSQKWWQEEGGK